MHKSSSVKLLNKLLKVRKSDEHKNSSASYMIPKRVIAFGIWIRENKRVEGVWDSLSTGH